MRRSLILLLALAVLSVGILAAAVPYVNRNAETVTYTEQRLYGDPAAGEGLQIESLLHSNGKLHWRNTITLGETVETDSDFHFTAQYEEQWERSRDTISLYCQSNMGMSSTAPIDFREKPNTAWLAEVLTAAAEQTPNGAEDYTVTVPLAPYMEYYEIAGDSTLPVGHTMDGPQLWPTATEFFHVPVREGDVAEITISKDDQGDVYSLSYRLPNVDNIYSNGIQGPDGCWYLLFTARDNDGNPIEGTAPQGIYRVPVQKLDEEDDILYQVVESEVELVYATEDGSALYGMEDDTRLLLTADTEDGSTAILFDWATMEQIQTFPIGGHYIGNEGGWYQSQVENDHVVTVSTLHSEEEENDAQWITVWALGEDGLYHQVVDCDTTAGMEENPIFTSSFFDGERFLRVGYADRYGDNNLHVQICDGQGLQYAALLTCNLTEPEDSGFFIQTENDRPTPGLASDQK